MFQRKKWIFSFSVLFVSVLLLSNINQPASTMSLAVDDAAVLTSPAPNSTLPCGDVTLTWSDVSALSHHLYIGASVGSPSYYADHQGGNSFTFDGFPEDGSTVYVRLWTRHSNWQYNDYTFTACTDGEGESPAVLTSPAPNSTLPCGDVTLTWSEVGASSHHLFIGASVGSSSYYADHQGGNSFTFDGFPEDGSTVYVRVWTRHTNWQYNDYTFTACTSVVPETPAVLISPAPNSTLECGDVAFTWSDEGASSYYFQLGSEVGGADYYASFHNDTSFMSDDLPEDGSTIYVRLFTYYPSSGWVYNDYTLTACVRAETPAVLIDPIAVSTNCDSITLRWSDEGASSYWLSIGSSSPGSSEHYLGNQGTNTSFTADGSYTDIVYVRLYTYYPSTGWLYTDYMNVCGD